MNIGVFVLFLAGLLWSSDMGRTISPANHSMTPSVGLEIGPAGAGVCFVRSVRSSTVERDAQGRRRARFFFSSVLPTGDPSAKRSSCSCKTLKQRFEVQGLKLAAISYDSPAILKDFSNGTRSSFLCWLTRTPKSFAASTCSTRKRRE